MNSLIAFMELTLFAAVSTGGIIGVYVILPGKLKTKVNEFFELNEGEYEVDNQTEVKKSYGPENKKPQLQQLYSDLSLLLNERSALQSALSEIQTIAANSDLDPAAKRQIKNIVIAALGYDDGQGGRRAVND